MSLKTFLKSKFNRILTALTAVAVAGAGISVGAIAGNNKAQEADATLGGTYFFDFSSYTWWANNSATISCYYTVSSGSGSASWPGNTMTASSTYLYRIDNVPSTVNMMIFNRGPGSSSTWNQTVDITPSDGYNCYTINAKSSSKYSGYWTNYYPSVTVSEYRVKDGTAEGTAFATVSTTANTQFSVPSDPSLSGYTFGGWYTDAACTSSYTARYLSSATSLYAKFTATAVTHTVSLYKAYSDTSTTELITTETATEGTSYTPAASPTSSTYTWDNKWYTDSACTTQYTAASLTANTSLYAKMVRSAYIVAKYTVLDGGTATALTSETVTTANASSYYPSDIVANATLGAWYTDSGLTTVFNQGSLASDITLYGKFQSNFVLRGSVAGWAVETPILSYNFSTGVYSFTRTFTAGEEFKVYKLSATATWYGKTSSGNSVFSSSYFSGTNNISSTYAYTFTITFTYTSSAGFTWTGCTLVANTYTISEYRVLGSTAEATAFATAQATQGTAFEVPARPADTPTGYTWDGWYTDSACTSAYTSRLWTADGNLYAHYTALVVYEAIVFDAYKGSANAATYYGYGSTYSTLLLASESATAGVNFTPTTTPAARTGYTFAGAWYTDPQCTTVYVTGSFTSNTYLFAKYTLTDTAHDAIYLMLSSIDSSLTLCLPDYRFSYNETTTRYEINQTFSNTTETFKFFDATRTNTLGSNVYGGYFASAFKYDEFTGTADSVIAVATTGTYQLSIRYSIGSATANYYGYWYEAIKSGADYSGAEIYLRGPYSDYTSNRSAYKFKWNSTVGDYELEATLTASDAIFFYYVGQTARGGWNQVIFGTTNFNQGALVDSTYRINVATNGTYHLAIKGSIAVAQSGADWASYWWAVTALSDVTYGYATEYRVLDGTAETSVIDIEKCAVGTSFTPQTLTVPTGYKLKGWSTSGTIYTAYSATSMTSNGMTLYCWFEALSYDTIYFGAGSSTSYTSANLSVHIWYHPTSGADVNLTGNWPGVTAASTSGYACVSSYDTGCLPINFPTGSSGTTLGNKLYKITIPQTLFASVPSGAVVHIIISHAGSEQTTGGNISFNVYAAGGYYQYTSGATCGYVSSDYDTAAALMWDTQKAIYDCTNSSSATNGYHSVCAMSQNTATTLNTRYTNASDTAKTLINAATISQYTLDTTKTAKWNGTAAAFTGAQTFARIALIAAGRLIPPITRAVFGRELLRFRPRSLS